MEEKQNKKTKVLNNLQHNCLWFYAKVYKYYSISHFNGHSRSLTQIKLMRG